MSLGKRHSTTREVRTGRWMASREEPFAVFVFGILKYALY
jgi:hypothetical protein